MNFGVIFFSCILVFFIVMPIVISLRQKRYTSQKEIEEFVFGQTDYHSSDEEDEWEEEEDMGVLIHFTPVAIFVYRSKEEIITSDSSGVYRLIDAEGKERELSGNVLSFEVNSQQELDAKLQAYHITDSLLPVIHMEVEAN